VVGYSTMVATAGLALACILNSQDTRHGSDYSSRNRPPTAPLFVQSLEVKVNAQDIVGNRNAGLDHYQLGSREIQKVDALPKGSQDEVDKNLLQTTLPVSHEYWTAAAVGNFDEQFTASIDRRLPSLGVKAQEQDVVWNMKTGMDRYQLGSPENQKVDALVRSQDEVDKNLLQTTLPVSHEYWTAAADGNTNEQCTASIDRQLPSLGVKAQEQDVMGNMNVGIDCYRPDPPENQKADALLRSQNEDDKNSLDTRLPVSHENWMAAAGGNVNEEFTAPIDRRLPSLGVKAQEQDVMGNMNAGIDCYEVKSLETKHIDALVRSQDEDDKDLLQATRHTRLPVSHEHWMAVADDNANEQCTASIDRQLPSLSVKAQEQDVAGNMKTGMDPYQLKSPETKHVDALARSQNGDDNDVLQAKRPVVHEYWTAAASANANEQCTASIDRRLPSLGFKAQEQDVAGNMKTGMDRYQLKSPETKHVDAVVRSQDKDDKDVLQATRPVVHECWTAAASANANEQCTASIDRRVPSLGVKAQEQDVLWNLKTGMDRYQLKSPETKHVDALVRSQDKDDKDVLQATRHVVHECWTAAASANANEQCTASIDRRLPSLGVKAQEQDVMGNMKTAVDTNTDLSQKTPLVHEFWMAVAEDNANDQLSVTNDRLLPSLAVKAQAQDVVGNVKTGEDRYSNLCQKTPLVHEFWMAAADDNDHEQIVVTSNRVLPSLEVKAQAQDFLGNMKTGMDRYTDLSQKTPVVRDYCMASADDNANEQCTASIDRRLLSLEVKAQEQDVVGNVKTDVNRYSDLSQKTPVVHDYWMAAADHNANGQFSVTNDRVLPLLDVKAQAQAQDVLGNMKTGMDSYKDLYQKPPFVHEYWMASADDNANEQFSVTSDRLLPSLAVKAEAQAEAQNTVGNMKTGVDRYSDLSQKTPVVHEYWMAVADDNANDQFSVTNDRLLPSVEVKAQAQDVVGIMKTGMDRYTDFSPKAPLVHKYWMASADDNANEQFSATVKTGEDRYTDLSQKTPVVHDYCMAAINDTTNEQSTAAIDPLLLSLEIKAQEQDILGNMETGIDTYTDLSQKIPVVGDYWMAAADDNAYEQCTASIDRRLLSLEVKAQAQDIVGNVRTEVEPFTASSQKTPLVHEYWMAIADDNANEQLTNDRAIPSLEAKAQAQDAVGSLKTGTDRSTDLSRKPPLILEYQTASADDSANEQFYDFPVSNNRTVLSLEVKAQDQGIFGNIKTGIDSHEICSPSVLKLDAFMSQYEDDKDVLQRILPFHEYWMEAADDYAGPLLCPELEVKKVQKQNVLADMMTGIIDRYADLSLKTPLVDEDWMEGTDGDGMVPQQTDDSHGAAFVARDPMQRRHVVIVADENNLLGHPLTSQEYTGRIPKAFMLPSSMSLKRKNGMLCRLVSKAAKMDLWEDMFTAMETYKKREGHCNVPSSYKEDGAILGSWVMRQRQAKEKGILSIDKERRLEVLGIVWNPIEAHWEERLALLEAYRVRGR
jgi:hypothetical protein